MLSISEINENLFQLKRNQFIRRIERYKYVKRNRINFPDNKCFCYEGKDSKSSQKQTSSLKKKYRYKLCEN